jgi:hypothetical protein
VTKKVHRVRLWLLGESRRDLRGDILLKSNAGVQTHELEALRAKDWTDSYIRELVADGAVQVLFLDASGSPVTSLPDEFRPLPPGRVVRVPLVQFQTPGGEVIEPTKAEK